MYTDEASRNLKTQCDIKIINIKTFRYKIILYVCSIIMEILGNLTFKVQ